MFSIVNSRLYKAVCSRDKKSKSKGCKSSNSVLPIIADRIIRKLGLIHDRQQTLDYTNKIENKLINNKVEKINEREKKKERKEKIN